MRTQKKSNKPRTTRSNSRDQYGLSPADPLLSLATIAADAHPKPPDTSNDEAIAAMLNSDTGDDYRSLWDTNSDNTEKDPDFEPDEDEKMDVSDDMTVPMDTGKVTAGTKAVTRKRKKSLATVMLPVPADYKQPRELGTGKLHLIASDRQKTLLAQIRHLSEWPITHIRPYHPNEFVGRHGPTPVLRYADSRYRSPLRCFGLFFDSEVYKLILKHTNEYGVKKYDDWVKLDRETLMAVIGTLIRMSFMPAHDITDYWHCERGWDPVRSIWSRNRFTRILLSLRTDSREEPPSDSPEDRLYDVQRLNDLLNERFARALHPPRNVTCDETMIAWRGIHEAFRRLIDKPISRGFLLYKLADRYGYVYRQILCPGASGQTGVSKDAVLSLMNGYFGKGHVVFMDSWYTSVELFLELWKRGTYAVGKVHPIRVFPYHVRHATVGCDKFVTVQHRDCIGLSATVYCNSTRRAELLSTATDLPMATVRIKPGTSSVSFPAPAVVAQYNESCGGVDEANRLAALRTTHRKHYHSYMTFLEHFINVAVANAWIIYDQWVRPHSPDLPITKFTEFMWELSKELIGTFNDRQRPVGRPPNPLVAVHQHIKPARQNGVHNQRNRCQPCARRPSTATHDKKTTCHCSCGEYVCETDPRCWPDHLAFVRAGSQVDS